jgi:signal transduction histidine kinase
MTREEALEALTRAAPAERLVAARYLQFWAVAGDIPELRTAIAKEPVGWVRRALEAALQRLGDKRSQTVDLDDISQNEGESTADLAALARARIARTVVHELEPIAGAIAYYADDEFEEYGSSKTRLHVERLAEMLRAIETLGKVSANPHFETIEMRRLLADVVEGERAAYGLDVRLEGPTTLLLQVDPGLIRVIVGNGIKNACESISNVTDRSTSVSVLFGATDRDAWVTVADTGIGLPSGSSSVLFEMGTSTKEDHLGMGLTLAAEAARALGGKLHLVTDSLSTRLEFSFPIGGGRIAGIPD